MKKTLSCGILAALLCSSTAVSIQAQTPDVDRTKYPDYSTVTTPDWSLAAPARDAKAAGMTRNAETKRPDHVNNAETKHFPPVFNQDGGSCGSASRICYMLSYELAAYRDLDGSKPENYYPSHFVWLHTYSPTDLIDQGKNGFVMHVGVPSAATYGGQTYSSLYGYQEANSEDFGWMQGYDKWFEAMHNRMLQPVNFPQSIETEEGREAVKNWLWNHNGDDDFAAGGICGVGVASGGVWKKIPKTDTNDKIGVTDMYYVYEWGTAVDHALTIVGYDDRIEFDLDKDGVYGEADADELGAWIIVNSWGDWCNGGFIYCPYAFAGTAFKNDGNAGSRTFNGDFWWPEIYKVRKDYRPLRTIKLEMDYSRRSEIALSAGISADVNATEPDKTVPFVHFTYAGDGDYGNTNPAPEVPMLGRWADGKLHTEPMEFGYDLTDLTDGYDMNQPLKYFFIIDTKEWAQGEGTLYNASIMDYHYDKQGIETPFGVGEGIEIKNQGKKTIISVVVQGSSYYAPQNVAYTDGTLTWQAPLTSAIAIDSYRIYADGTPVADQKETTYKPTAKANEYSVTAIYADGNESTAVTVQAPAELSDPNMGVDFAHSGFTIPGVFANKYEQATLEYWIKPNVITSWNQSGGPGWGKFMFHFNADGTYTAGWATEPDRATTGFKINTGEWTHIALVVDKNKMSIYINGVNRKNVVSNNYSGLGGFGDLVFSSSAVYNSAQNAAYDEIRIWNTARTGAEIKAYKDVEFTGSIMPQNLIAYIKGDLITDSEGNTLMRDYAGGHHATIHNNNYSAVSTGTTLAAPTAAPTVSIDKPTGTVYAGIPVTLTATVNEATSQLTWTAEAAGINGLTVVSPTLTFTKAGTHTVNVTATSASGQTATASATITVEAAPAPDATFTMTATDGVPAGERVTLHANTPRVGYLYQWSMPGADIQSAAAPSIATSWQRQGTYKVTLTVTAPDGTKKSHSENISVMEVAPEADFTLSPTVVLKGEPFTLNDASKYTPTKRKWHISNGADNYIVYADTNTIAIDKPGIYDVTLTVANNSGQSISKRERALIVTNADSKNGLVFGDNAAVTAATSPIAPTQKAFTIEWWMNAQWPADNTNGIGDSEETILLQTLASGKVQLCLNSRYAASPENFVVPGEWHHYTVVFNTNRARFYRDGVLINTQSMAPISTLPELSTFRIGGAQTPFRGSIDELRVWADERTADEILAGANAPIDDVAKAVASQHLMLYYDFNQNGGDVQDATSNANHGTRTGFGPDGDALSLSKGVFCLSTSGKADDITADKLTNHAKAFQSSNTCINPNLANRAFAITGWTLENTIEAAGITTGAHVDKMKGSCFAVSTGWDGFATALTDHKVYQTIKLAPGCYTLTAEYDKQYEGQCGASYLVAAIGKTLPVTDDLGQALAYTAMQPKGTVSSNAVTFVLDTESEVSLGLLVNMSGSQYLALQSFTLTKSDVTTYGTTEEIPVPAGIDMPTADTTPTAAQGIYDLTGRRVENPVKGIYIVNGKKVVIK